MREYSSLGRLEASHSALSIGSLASSSKAVEHSRRSCTSVGSSQGMGGTSGRDRWVGQPSKDITASSSPEVFSPHLLLPGLLLGRSPILRASLLATKRAPGLGQAAEEAASQFFTLRQVLLECKCVCLNHAKCTTHSSHCLSICWRESERADGRSVASTESNTERGESPSTKRP